MKSRTTWTSKIALFTLFALWAYGAPIASAAPVPALEKVMIVIFENEDYSATLAQPFFGQLAQTGVVLGNMNAEAHPSQPNYIALTSGSMNGVSDDSNHNVNARNIVDLLEAQGKRWKVYAEAWPGNCFTGARSGTYARKHNPFISFLNIQGNASRCANIVDASIMDQDLAAGTLPDYAFYIPDMNNDGHDTDVEFADKWFAGRFGPLLKDPRFSQETVLATFDESSLFGGNKIYTAIVGNHVIPGATTQARYDHYSLLRTLELGLGLGDLGGSDVKAPSIDGIWR